jgi:signal transduction histidine kinase
LVFSAYILILASFFIAFLAFTCFKYKNTKGAYSFGFLLGSILLYCTGYAFEIQSDSLQKVIWSLRIEYLGISYFPSLLIIFSWQYIRKDKWIKAPVFVMLFLISTFTLFAQYTTEWLHWFYKDMALVNYNGIFIVKTQKGFWYWIHQAYSLCAMISFNGVFLYLFVQKEKNKKKQSVIMLLSSLAPWIFYLAYITGSTPYGFDPIPFSFVLMALCMGWGMFKYRLFDLTPIAMNNIFNHISDGIIIVDELNGITCYNEAASKVFPSFTENQTGKPLHVLFQENNLQDQMKEGKIMPDIEIGTEDNKKYFEAKTTEILDSTGQIKGSTIIFHDVTERKLNEMLLINNQKELITANQTKERIISIIGHDLRGPIGNISSLSELLNDSLPRISDAEKEKFLNMISRSSEQSLKLIDNLLLWARTQSNNIKYQPLEFNLLHFMTSTLELFMSQIQAKEQLLKMNIGKELKMQADPQMLSVVVRNLISNAIKFTPKQGTIFISATCSDEEITVKIEDSGIGIPQNMMSSLYTMGNKHRLGTENERGTGLGLALCSEFIKINRGKLGCKNREEGGSCFYFTIPKEAALSVASPRSV